jgi:hypothetical protein
VVSQHGWYHRATSTLPTLNREFACPSFAAARAAAAAAFTAHCSARPCAATGAGRRPSPGRPCFTPHTPPGCGLVWLSSPSPLPAQSGSPGQPGPHGAFFVSPVATTAAGKVAGPLVAASPGRLVRLSSSRRSRVRHSRLGPSTSAGTPRPSACTFAVQLRPLPASCKLTHVPLAGDTSHNSESLLVGGHHHPVAGGSTTLRMARTHPPLSAAGRFPRPRTGLAGHPVAAVDCPPSRSPAAHHISRRACWWAGYLPCPVAGGGPRYASRGHPPLLRPPAAGFISMVSARRPVSHGNCRLTRKIQN